MILGGSWVVMRRVVRTQSGFVRRVTILLTLLRTTHLELPMNLQVGFGVEGLRLVGGSSSVIFPQERRLFGIPSLPPPPPHPFDCFLLTVPL